MERQPLKRAREESNNLNSNSINRTKRLEKLTRLRNERKSKIEDIGSQQTIKDGNFEEIAIDHLKKEERENYYSGYHKILAERTVKESIAVKMYEVIKKCLERNERDLIEPFLSEVRKLDIYKQADTFDRLTGEIKWLERYQEEKMKDIERLENVAKDVENDHSIDINSRLDRVMELRREIDEAKKTLAASQKLISSHEKQREAMQLKWPKVHNQAGSSRQTDH